jgi:hypothetical protein
VAARTGTHRHIKHHVDSVAASCARAGVDARAFVEFAEMQGFIVRQPSVDEGDGAGGGGLDGGGYASASGEWAGRAERDEPSGESGVGGGRRLLWPAEAEEAAAANAQEAPPAANGAPAPLTSAAANGAAQPAPPDSDGPPAAPHGTTLPRREHADAGHSHNGGGGRNGGGRGGRLLRRTPAPQHSGPAEARPV